MRATPDPKEAQQQRAIAALSASPRLSCACMPTEATRGRGQRATSSAGVVPGCLHEASWTSEPRPTPPSLPRKPLHSVGQQVGERGGARERKRLPSPSCVERRCRGCHQSWGRTRPPQRWQLQAGSARCHVDHPATNVAASSAAAGCLSWLGQRWLAGTWQSSQTTGGHCTNARRVSVTAAARGKALGRRARRLCGQGAAVPMAPSVAISGAAAGRYGGDDDMA